jgi:hypothetical protein
MPLPTVCLFLSAYKPSQTLTNRETQPQLLNVPPADTRASVCGIHPRLHLSPQLKKRKTHQGKKERFFAKK